MTARRLFTVMRALLSETKSQEEIEDMLTPPDPIVAEQERRFREWKAAQG